MVSNLTLAFITFTMLFTLLMPILAAILYYRKKKYALPSVFTGVLVFIVFQMVLRMPLIQTILPRMAWYQTLSENAVLYAIFLGLTAGLFEETGRFLAFKTILKKNLDHTQAVAYGIGHGGIEAMLLIGFTYINNLIISLMINSGAFEQVIGATLPAATAAQVKATLVDTDSLMFILPSLERASTFLIQIGLSVLIQFGIKRGKGLAYLIVAILIHTLLDASSVILMNMGLNIWLLEAYVALYAAVAMIFVWKTAPRPTDKINAL